MLLYPSMNLVPAEGDMKVGDLVSVKRTHGRAPIAGIVLEIDENDPLSIALVMPCSSESNQLIWANPLDVEVLNESR